MTLTAILGAGCGGTTRSATAVCHVWSTDGVALHSHYEHDATVDGGLGSLLDVVSAPNDIATLLEKMAAVAPSGIEPDMTAVATALKTESSSLGSELTDPLGALATNLVNGMSVSGSYDRVNAYIANNCKGAPGTGT